MIYNKTVNLHINYVVKCWFNMYILFFEVVLNEKPVTLTFKCL